MDTFFHIKEGDRVVRLLSESVPMILTVKKVDERLIYATSSAWMTLDPDEDPGNFWTFERENGVEEDLGLSWGTKFGVTGSRLLGLAVDDEQEMPVPPTG